MSIEGAWGSGKSSLVNLLVEELDKEPMHAPEVVRFEPWLVGDRDGMLVELMSDLAAAVEAIQTPEKGQSENFKKEAGKLASQLRKYASKLSGQMGSLAQFAELLEVPGAGKFGKIFKFTKFVLTNSESANGIGAGKPLPQIKAELTEGLLSLQRRIVVIIDDLDRLEAHEAIEIMRLIKAVADFPNVVYILCYDPEILADGLRKMVHVGDGTTFLEKIVQVRFSVPQPEAFDLRRWFLKECLAAYSVNSDEQLISDELQRLQLVCDVEGLDSQTKCNSFMTGNCNGNRIQSARYRREIRAFPAS